MIHPLAPHIGREEVSQSVYRMSEEITVDVTPFCKDQKDPSACVEAVGKTYTFGWTGTAWTVDRMRGRSFLMTAGHMCESKDTYEYTDASLAIDDDGNLTIVEKKYELPIVKAEYDFHGADGTDYVGAKVVRDDDDIDLCELQIAGDLGTPIPLADHDPDYGEHCYYTGAPSGIWGGGIAGTFDLVFSGRGDMFGEGQDKLAFTGLGKGGASGSPMICDGQAVGVLVEGPRNFQGMFMGTPQDEMREFHRKARHRS
jgi:hypothetical protein